MGFPSLSDIEASIGAFTSSGKLGQVGAGKAVESAAATVQQDMLAFSNKAGQLLGPILGTAGVRALTEGAAGTAATAQTGVINNALTNFSNNYLMGYDVRKVAAVGLAAGVALYLILRRK